MQISVTILTKNAGETLLSTLMSVQKFPEIIILDTGSTDDTLKIAEQFPNVKIFSTNFTGFGPLHNQATALATGDWVLSIDSDEVLTPELGEEIQKLTLDPETVYSLPRDNYFNGKRIRYCAGWYPDPVVRLYNRRTTHFTDDAVHEKVVTDGLRLVALKSPLKHTPYRNMAHFLDKMQKYTTLFAEQNRGKKHSSVSKALGHSVGAFIKNYFFKRGFMGGKEGLIISLYNAQTAFYKYLKLAELNKKL